VRDLLCRKAPSNPLYRRARDAAQSRWKAFESKSSAL
jgi:hypothetical protein